MFYLPVCTGVYPFSWRGLSTPASNECLTDWRFFLFPISLSLSPSHRNKPREGKHFPFFYLGMCPSLHTFFGLFVRLTSPPSFSAFILFREQGRFLQLAKSALLIGDVLYFQFLYPSPPRTEINPEKVSIFPFHVSIFAYLGSVCPVNFTSFTLIK